MTNPTSNFGWQMPTSTDLVTDLPADFETFGQAVDTSMADLKGGTTGQILSKTTNTDMDFTWITNDVGDITAVTAGTGISGGGTSGAVTVTNSMATTMTTKGDLVPATGSGTFARLAAGANGETLVADSSTSTGLRYQGNFAAGKNAIINGAFNVWQRGTSFSNPAFLAFNADRWQSAIDNVPTSQTISRQTFTPGTAPVLGYEGQYFWRSLITTVGTNTVMQHLCTMENVQTYAGQTATVSFWAKADGARNLGVLLEQNFGSGGSGSVQTSTTTLSLTTAWTRFTVTIAIPSISGKTVGASSFLRLILIQASASGSQLDLWGVQLEAGSVATAFQTATGTIQGELDACKYYYRRLFGLQLAASMSTGNAAITIPFGSMRTTPSTTTSITDANYNTKWAMVNMGIAAASKTGTSVIGFEVTGSSTSQQVSMRITGATWSIVPNGLQFLSDSIIEMSSEL